MALMNLKAVMKQKVMDPEELGQPGMSKMPSVERQGLLKKKPMLPKSSNEVQPPSGLFKKLTGGR